MRITALETLQIAEASNLVWVELQTDAGITGLGETFRNPEATVAYLHETCAPYLLGQDPLRIERHARALMAEVGSHFAGYPSRSIELRGNSAVDLALWDLFGKAAGLPLYQLLGGLSRDRIRIYNTCASAAITAPPALSGTPSCCARATARPASARSTTSPPSTSGRASSPGPSSRRASAR